MLVHRYLGLALTLTAASAPLHAQVGVQDQVSEFVNASLLVNHPTHIWQQQVRTGITGTLEGFKLLMNGNAGSAVHARLRAGGGWSTQPILFETPIVNSTAGWNEIFVDVEQFAIQVTAGDVFVIELQGTNGGGSVAGSFAALPQVYYGEPLFSQGSSTCFFTCEHRMGFQTYVIPDLDANVYCVGDGSGSACPCGNTSAVGSKQGCLHSLGNGGRLRSIGTASLSSDSVQLRGALMPDSPALYFQGTTRVGGGSGIPFGDGLNCAGGTIVRLGTKHNVFGASKYPGPGDAPVSMRGLVTTPGVRTYQVRYRNAAAFCTPSSFNWTNGIEIVWEL